MMTFKIHRIGLTCYIYKKRMNLHICPSSAQVSGKTFETNETNTTNPILVQIFKGTVWGCTENDQTPRKGISYLYPLFLFLLVVFQTSSMKRIKRNMPILTEWLFPVLYRASNRRCKGSNTKRHSYNVLDI